MLVEEFVVPSKVHALVNGVGIRLDELDGEVLRVPSIVLDQVLLDEVGSTLLHSRLPEVLPEAPGVVYDCDA